MMILTGIAVFLSPWIKRAAASAAWRFASSKLGIIAIAGALLIISNLAGGVLFHMRGYNSAIATCQSVALKRRNAELGRDASIAVDLSLSQMAQQRIRSQRDAARDKEIADYEANHNPVSGCVVPRDADVWMRQKRRD